MFKFILNNFRIKFHKGKKLITRIYKGRDIIYDYFGVRVWLFIKNIFIKNKGEGNLEQAEGYSIGDAVGKGEIDESVILTDAVPHIKGVGKSNGDSTNSFITNANPNIIGVGKSKGDSTNSFLTNANPHMIGIGKIESDSNVKLTVKEVVDLDGKIEKILIMTDEDPLLLIEPGLPKPETQMMILNDIATLDIGNIADLDGYDYKININNNDPEFTVEDSLSKPETQIMTFKHVAELSNGNVKEINLNTGRIGLKIPLIGLFTHEPLPDPVKINLYITNKVRVEAIDIDESFSSKEILDIIYTASMGTEDGLPSPETQIMIFKDKAKAEVVEVGESFNSKENLDIIYTASVNTEGGLPSPETQNMVFKDKVKVEAADVDGVDLMSVNIDLINPDPILIPEDPIPSPETQITIIESTGKLEGAEGSEIGNAHANINIIVPKIELLAQTPLSTPGKVVITSNNKGKIEDGDAASIENAIGNISLTNRDSVIDYADSLSLKKYEIRVSSTGSIGEGDASDMEAKAISEFKHKSIMSTDTNEISSKVIFNIKESSILGEAITEDLKSHNNIDINNNSPDLSMGSNMDIKGPILTNFTQHAMFNNIDDIVEEIAAKSNIEFKSNGPKLEIWSPFNVKPNKISLKYKAPTLAEGTLKDLNPWAHQRNDVLYIRQASSIVQDGNIVYIDAQ